MEVVRKKNSCPNCSKKWGSAERGADGAFTKEKHKYIPFPLRFEKRK